MKEQQNLTTKIQKQMPEFFDEVASLDSDALEHRVVQLAKDLGDVEKAKEGDEALEQARETAKELNAPYNESRKAIRLKTSYLIQLLEEKGK
jgi:hypothetical protein